MLKTYLFYFSCLCSLALLSPQQSIAQCPCTNCPQAIPDLTTTTIDLNVSGATNAVLGQNGQALCGVNLSMNHEYLSDIQITLTAPNGSSVILAGPSALSAPTNGTNWAISFVPCTQPAAPDFPSTFSANFTTIEPWGSGGIYIGSYYPFMGCFADFNGSNVNGNWTLSILDDLIDDVGELVNFELIFCDISGIDCFSCEANAGNITNSDLTTCLGDPSLNLGLTPTYAMGVTPPAAADYTYTYIVSQGGVITAFQNSSDLRAFPAGTYNLCGLSHLTSQSSMVPAPNGVLTSVDLRNQLSSLSPPFCGDVTDNCMNITINPSVPDTHDTLQICEGACEILQGNSVCSPGDYAFPATLNGCAFTANYHVTQKSAPVTNLQEAICQGGISMYTFVPVPYASGIYRDTIKTTMGCDSILVLDFEFLGVQAAIEPTDTLSCDQPTLVLDGSFSSFGNDINYIWTTAGGNIVSDPTLDTIRISEPGIYTLTVCNTSNGFSCCLDSNITVLGSKNIPPSPSNILGLPALCQNQSASYTLVPTPEADSYIWTTSNGVPISFGQGTDSIVVDFGQQNSSICAASINACGTSPTACLQVNLSTTPNQPSFSGLDTACLNQNTVYSVLNLQPDTYYSWQILNGTGTYNVDSTTVTVLWTASPGQICLKAQNSCGMSPDSCLDVFAPPLPAAPNLTGPMQACTGDTLRYFFPNGSTSSNYAWSISGSNISIQFVDTAFVDLVWLSTGTDSVCISEITSCGQSPNTCVTSLISEKPIAYAGLNDTICGQASNFAADLPSIGQGTWMQLMGPSAASITDIHSPHSSLSVTAFGLYRFVWEVANANCSAQDTVELVFNENPRIGQAQILCNITNDSFSVSFPITGGIPPYSIGSQTITSSIFTSTPIESGQNFGFLVTDAQGCKSNLFDGSHNCMCTTSAGTMSLNLLESCVGDSVIAQSSMNVTLDVNDVFEYVLHDGSGTSLGTIFSKNTSRKFGFSAGMVAGQTYYISAIAGNPDSNGSVLLSDACLSTAQGQPVVFRPLPQADAGLDKDTCSLETTLNGNFSTGFWLVISNPLGSSSMLTNFMMPQTNISVNTPGTYALQWLVEENGCTGRDTVEINFKAPPSLDNIVENCSVNNDSFTVSFSITGGLAPYTVNGTILVGNQFTAAPLLSGSSYNFIVEDAQMCQSQALQGQFSCLCSTDAGTMSQNVLQACAGDTVTATFNNNAFLDGNDSLIYVLHDGAGISLGTVFAQNKTGEFTFQAGMNFSQTYYISTVVGSADLGGMIDFTDPCLSVALGQPLLFSPIPLADAGIDLDTCALGTMLNGNGLIGEWNTLSSPLAAAPVFSSALAPSSTYRVDLPGQYVLEWTVQENGCTNQDTVVLTFKDSPIISTILETCLPTNDSFSVSFSIQGGIGPYSINGTQIVGNQFSSAYILSGSSYNFSVEDAQSCTSTPLLGQFNCLCNTDAGSMDLSLTELCAGDTVHAIYNNDAVLEANDAFTFVLHDGNGTTLGAIIDTSTSGAFVFQTGMVFSQTYYISAMAGNADAMGAVDLSDPCLSISQGQPLVFYANPIADAGLDRDTCATNLLLDAQNASGLWSILTTPTNAQPSFSGAMNPKTAFQTDSTGFYALVWSTTTTNGCSDKDTVELRLQRAPSVVSFSAVCNAAFTMYVIEFDIQNGTAPFVIQGLSGTLMGNHFVSDSLPSGSMYQFYVEDANACQSLSLSGTQDCSCGTFSGTMTNLNLLEFCQSEPALVQWDANAILNTDDVIGFVLHTEPGITLGTVLGLSNQPSFSFSPLLSLGQTYYISAVAGEVVNGSIDLSDPCLSVSLGTPITWLASPTAELPMDTLNCSGNTIDLQLSGTGMYPLSVELMDNFNQTYFVSIDASGSGTISLSPSVTTTYNLVSVQEAGTNTCVNDTSNLQFTVGVEIAPRAELDTIETICNNALFGSILDFSTLILSGNNSGTWQNISSVGTGSLPNLDFDAVLPGTYTFEYQTNSALVPCADTTYQVKIEVVDCPCPPVSISPFGTLCTAENTIDLAQNLQPSTTTGAWFIDGLPMGSNPATLSGSILKTENADPGVYSIVFLLIPAGPPGCPTVIRQDLTLAKQLSAGLPTPPLDFCAQIDTLVDLSTLLTNSTAGGTWLETSLVGSTGTAFSPLGTFQPLAQNIGTYHFSYIVSNISPCPNDTSEVEIQIRPNPTAAAGADQTLSCVDSLALLGSSLTSQGNDFSYAWSLGGLLFANSDTLFWESETPGTFELFVQNTTTGCSATDSVLVDLDASFPYFESISILQPSCLSPTLGSLSISPISGGIAPYDLSLNGISYGNQSEISDLPIGNYALTLTDAEGCAYIYPDSIQLFEPVDIKVSFPNAIETINLGTEITIKAEIKPLGFSPQQIIWSTLFDSLAVESLEQTFSPNQTQTLEITVVDTFGCSSSAQVLIAVDNTRHIYLPNTFTPTGSDNNFYTIFTGPDVEKVENFQIYNRWGALIFENETMELNAENSGWDGTENGKKALPAVYVVKALVYFKDGSSEWYVEDFSLIR